MILNEIREEMEKMGEQSKAAFNKKYLKSPYEFYGLRTPQIREVAKKFKDLKMEEVYALFDFFWNSGNHEEMSLAIYILHSHKKEFDLGTWNFVTERLGRLKSWDHVDGLSAWVLGEILLENVQLMSEVKMMAKSRNPWIRRTAIISTYPLIKKGKIELAIRLAEELIYDKDVYVQKGAGWMLREAGKKNRIVIREFILDHYDMKANALSYATEKMPELRKIIKEKKKEKKDETKLK